MSTDTQETTAGNVATPEERGEDFGGPSRDELMAALRDAGGTGAVDVEAEESAAAARAAAEKHAPAAPSAAPTTAADAPTNDPDEPKIAAVIRAREAAHRERETAHTEAARLKAQAEVEAKALLEQAKERARLEHDAWIAEQRAKFQESPTEVMRQLAGDPERAVEAVVREGTPEWKAMRQLQVELEATKKQASKADEVAAELKSYREERAREKRAEEVAEAKGSFLTQHASPDKTPYLHKRWDPDEIFERANALAVKWQMAGVEFAHSDVAEYLEHQARKRILGDATGSAPQQVSGAAGQPAGNAPKGKATNGTRTLSAASGSERRTSPKLVREMSADEEREALIAEARDARKRLGNPDV